MCGDIMKSLQIRSMSSSLLSFMSLPSSFPFCFRAENDLRWRWFATLLLASQLSLPTLEPRCILLQRKKILRFWRSSTLGIVIVRDGLLCIIMRYLDNCLSTHSSVRGENLMWMAGTFGWSYLVGKTWPLTLNEKGLLGSKVTANTWSLPPMGKEVPKVSGVKVRAHLML